MKIKSFISTVLGLVISLVAFTQGYYHTITSQAELNSAVFPAACDVTLDNDTTLPVSEQIHDLSPLQNIDTLVLSMYNTRVSNCSALDNLSFLLLAIEGDEELEDLNCLNQIPRLSSVYLYDLPMLTDFNLNSNTVFLSNLVIQNCDKLKDIDVTLPNLVVPENPNHRLNVSIRYNDSLEHIAIRNPNEALFLHTIEENLSLKELFLDGCTNLKLLFNPKLQRILGFENYKKPFGFTAKYNYELEDLCAMQKNLERAVEVADSLGNDIEQYIEIVQNGSNTSTLQDILDYPCAPAGVNGSYAASMHIYPNPTTGLLQVEGLPAPTAYRLLNLQGQVVQRGIAQPQQPLHLEQVPEGLYFLELEGAAPLKVVKR